MQAYAEGFDILRNANAEALPTDEQRYRLRPRRYRRAVAARQRGDFLVARPVRRLRWPAHPGPLANFSGFVQDSGEGRWTVQAAIDEAVPAEVLTAALYARFRSRQEHTFAEKMLSAMRQGFGGHVEPTRK
jgi:6-phosphogluconate dehydrogenase